MCCFDITSGNGSRMRSWKQGEIWVEYIFETECTGLQANSVSWDRSFGRQTVTSCIDFGGKVRVFAFLIFIIAIWNFGTGRFYFVMYEYSCRLFFFTFWLWLSLHSTAQHTSSQQETKNDGTLHAYFFKCCVNGYAQFFSLFWVSKFRSTYSSFPVWSFQRN